MLNQDLIDPKDLEIARLKLIIEKFKKYDAERKQYYSKALQRLGGLEEYIEEIESNSVISKLKKKVKEQEKHLAYLNRIITVNKYHLFNDDYVLQYTVSAKELKERNKALSNEVTNLRKTVKDLVCRLHEK